MAEAMHHDRCGYPTTDVEIPAHDAVAQIESSQGLTTDVRIGSRELKWVSPDNLIGSSTREV